MIRYLNTIGNISSTRLTTDEQYYSIIFANGIDHRLGYIDLKFTYTYFAYEEILNLVL